MSKKSDSVSSASKARTNPFTPMRRFIFKLELLKPIVALGKRVRDQYHVANIPEHLREKQSSHTIEYPPLGSSSFGGPTTFVKDRQTRQGIARIALQQHDQPLDAIVITTLPSYPFCCHEDLLMMSRSQLVEVASLLNSRLPTCSQIELADGIADAHIRYSIETLVGIVPELPGAPKAVKSRRFERTDTGELDLLDDLEQDALPSPPTSPLSMRVSRRQEKALPVMSSPPYLLESLEEEDENDFFTINRPLKKKRKMLRSVTSTLDEDIEMGTPPNTRFSQRILEQPSSPSPILNPDVFTVDSTFINMKPRHRSTIKNSARKRGASGKIASGSQPNSSRKPTTNKAKRKYPEKQAITLNYRPFEFPTDEAGRYDMRSKSSNSLNEKGTMISNGDNVSWFESGISPVEYEDNQMGLENLTVGYD